MTLAPMGVTANTPWQSQAEKGDRWGSSPVTRATSASVAADFPCALGPYGVAEHSHYTISASGNEALTCSGRVSAPAIDRALKLAGFACVLPSGTVTTDSRFVLTPSGEASLTCRASKSE